MMAPSLLRSLLYCAEIPPQILLISDVFGVSCTSQLFASHIGSLLKNGYDVHCVCNKILKRSLANNNEGDPHMHYYTYKWQSSNCVGSHNLPLTTALQTIKEMHTSASRAPALVIEDVNDVLHSLLLHELLRCCRTVIEEYGGVVVLVFHRDADPDASRLYAALRQSTDASISVTLPAVISSQLQCSEDAERWPSSLSSLRSIKHIAKVDYRKPSGKWLRSLEMLSVSDNEFTMQPLPSLNIEEMTSLSTVSSSQDALKNLTFNLSLSDSQRTAKNKLVLPHTRAAGPEVAKTAPVIHYSYDKEDWDDEDPDDDLDI